MTGLGSGRDWPAFALAWQGVTYGVSDEEALKKGMEVKAFEYVKEGAEIYSKA